MHLRIEAFATEVVKKFFVEDIALSDPFALMKGILELPDVSSDLRRKSG